MVRSAIIRLLIVEDNSEDFLLIKDYLSKEFLHPIIEEVQTYTAAKIKLKNSAHFDTILVKLHLLDADSEIMVSKLVKLAGSIPIIILSGNADKDFGNKILALGVSDYLLKNDLTSMQLYKSIAYSLERRHINKDLKESELKYRNLFNLSPIPIWVYDQTTLAFLHVNEAAIKHYGYSKKEFLTMTVHDIKPREKVAGMKEVITSSENLKKSIYRHLKKNGDLIDVEIHSNEINFNNKKACIVLSNDISASVYQQNILAFEKEVYELIATKGISFKEVLKKLIQRIEQIMPASFCSMLQKNEDNTIQNLAAGSVPIKYIKLLNGLAIGSAAGSCGTAMFTGQNVIVADIETDPLWQNYRAIIQPFGFKACWSVPIKKTDGKIVGSVASYFKNIKSPLPHHLNLLERAASLVGILMENRDAAQNITQSNERYNIVAKATSDVIWDWDIAAEKIIWSKGLKEILGYSELNDTTYQDWWSSKVHPEDVKRVTENINNHVKNKIIKWQDEYRFKAANGIYKYIADAGFLILDKNQNASKMVGAMQDITKQKEEEHQLKLLESVITNTNDSVMITTAEPFDEPGPYIIYVNEAFTKMTGYTAAEVIGKTPRILHGVKTDKKELERFKETIKKWKACEMTIINYKKNGEEFWNNMSISPVADVNGFFTHWIAVERDVTASLKKEQEITKAIIQAQEQERSQIGGELHDNVNQILAGVLLNLGMTKGKPLTEQNKWIDISSGYVHMAIKEIRKLSHRLAPVSVDDNSLKETFEELLKSVNINKQFEIKFSIKEVENIEIIGDIQLNLYRILQEQLNNIVKYSKASIIEVSLLLSNNAIQFRIYDNGIGFDTKKNRKGIGLNNIKKRAELFSGNFYIKSSEGNGCEINVEIPLQ